MRNYLPKSIIWPRKFVGNITRTYKTFLFSVFNNNILRSSLVKERSSLTFKFKNVTRYIIFQCLLTHFPLLLFWSAILNWCNSENINKICIRLNYTEDKVNVKKIPAPFKNIWKFGENQPCLNNFQLHFSSYPKKIGRPP